MTWVIVLTVLVTAVVVVIGLNFATSDKRIERRINHHYSIGDEQFEREMAVMLGPGILPGNHVQAFNNGHEIFPAMLEAIHSARTSITFETYIYWSGEIGRAFSDALSERSRAGVPVHVTIDWVGSLKMDEALLKSMEDAGVEVQRYRPLHWYSLTRMNNRTHRKLLVVDGRIGFTGGVGIADLWEGTAQDPDHWRDMHFRIDGPAVAQVQAAFNDNWIKTTGVVLSGPTYFPRLEPVGDMHAHMIIASPAGGSESMHLMYLMSIAAAQQTIDLAAAYFVPDELIVEALLTARRRGVRIRVLVPGPHIDAATVRLSSRSTWGALLRNGIEIHEYQPTMMHTKLLVVDGTMSSVGSTNFDIRSFRLNDEASLNIYDAAFAEAMTEVFEHDLKSAKRYTHEMWVNRPWREKMAERITFPFKSQL